MRSDLARTAGGVSRRLFRCAIVLFSSLTICFPAVPAWAQQLPVTPDQIQQIQQLQQLQQGQQRQYPVDTGAPPSVVLTPGPDVTARVPADSRQEQSRLERIMSDRAGTPLRQFGYDLLGTARSVTVPQTGAVQDDYVLGTGDEIVISLRGQENNEIRVTVDRNGQVLLPRLAPISATGRTFGSFRQDVEAAVRRAYVATNAFVSLGRVRQISVFVSGEVNAPGQRLVTGLSSVVDALLLSGGVKKTGSLRNIRVQRGSRTFVVDLYNVLTSRGGPPSMRLADGDMVLVPALGRTIAAAGLVRQPGIYELASGQSSISVRALLNLAGGTEVRGAYRLSVLRIQPDGRSDFEPVTESGVVRDSEVLFAQLNADQTANQATLAGGTSLAGRYPVTTGTRLSDVLKAPGALGPAPYTLFGIIARKDPRTLLRTLVAFTPLAVITGKEDLVLQGDDIIRVLSVNEIRILTKVVADYRSVQQAREDAIHNPLGAAEGVTNPVAGMGQGVQQVPGVQPGAQAGQFAQVPQPLPADQLVQATQPGQPLPPSQFASDLPDVSGNGGQDRLLDRVSDQRTRESDAVRTTGANFQDEVLAPGKVASNREITTLSDLARQLGVDNIVLTNFLIDHQATLQGAVRGPGEYFVGSSVELRDLVQAAGGTVNWVDASGVELITTAVDAQTGHSITRRVSLPYRNDGLSSYIVKGHDQLRFNPTFTDVGVGQVTVQGEFRYTGTYEITRGEHLSDLVGRAGGLTNSAYPYGTVFLRKSAAVVERESYIRAAKEVEDQLVVAMTRVGNNKIDPAAFSAMQSFVVNLRNQKALGRIAITADPSLLAAKPELDPLLEPGDVIFVPQRPATVSVLGEVMQPGAYPYRADQTVKDYISRAGGYSGNSDDSNTYIVLPDGSARKVERSWLSFSAENLPPGSAIVVPRDIAPLDLRQTIIDVSQILSQLAVSIASVAVLSRN